MIDFEIQRSGRRCAKSDREFVPGEMLYSVLVAEGGEVVRLDIAKDAWEGPPENAIGWWQWQTPTDNVRKKNWAPNDVMLDYFQRLEDNPAKRDVRYILTLLMIRRKILRLEDTECNERGREVLVVFCPRTESEYHVEVVTPDSKRAQQIQDELFGLLYGDNP